MSASKTEPFKRLPFLSDPFTDPPADWEKAEAADAPDAHVFAQGRVVAALGVPASALDGSATYNTAKAAVAELSATRPANPDRSG